MKHFLKQVSSLRRLLIIFSLLLLFFLTVQISNVYSQAPTILWDKTIGGTAEDQLCCIQQTTDGGFILGGWSSSTKSGDKSENSRDVNDGLRDYWIVKLNAAGAKEWDKTVGGIGDDILFSLQQTADGGYILGGASNSYGFEKTTQSKGGYDYWIVKLNSSGGKEWDKTYGGFEYDYLTSLQQTKDDGFILAGVSYSNAGFDKSEDNRNGVEYRDFWLIKISASGNKEWDKTIGGIGDEDLKSVQQTSDGGYILGGWSLSDAGFDKSEEPKGFEDYWLVKLDISGNKLWDKTIGGNGMDVLGELKLTSDGGYILGGSSYSNASFDKSENSNGSNDYWIVKLNATGNKIWDKTIGGTGGDNLTSVQQTTDGGYFLAGYSDSHTGFDKSQDRRGFSDYWVVKLNDVGTKLWDKTIGGTGVEYLTSAQQTTDGGYFLGGNSRSNASFEKSENLKGIEDYWVVRLAPEIVHAQPKIKSLTLVNADLDQDIRELKDKDRIDLVSLGNPLFSVRANAEPNPVDSVIFEFKHTNTKMKRVERYLPYALYGDAMKSGAIDYKGQYWEKGLYKLKATPYLNGVAGSTYEVKFKVKGDLPPAMRIVYGKETKHQNDRLHTEVAKITASPNPFSHTLTLQIQQLQGKVDVSIYTMTGNKVYQTTRQLSTIDTEAVQSLLRLDIYGLSLQPGMYTVRIISENGKTASVKVIKY